MSVAHSGTAAAPLPERIILFDGICGFCDWSIGWLIDHDRQGRFHFAPLQGSTADLLRASHPEAIPEAIETVVFVDNSGPQPRILLRSEAAFAIFAELEGPARHVARLRVLPRFLTDLAYHAFAAIRYRVFGKLDACRLPSPEERARFLD